MLAAQLEDGSLSIRDLPLPEPGDGEALVKISAAGICHSDLHLARGDWLGVGGTMSLGHEGIGIVEALGPGAERRRCRRRPRDPRARRRRRWVLVRRLPVLPQRPTAPVSRHQGADGHVRRVPPRVEPGVGEDPRQPGRSGGAARVRGAHGVRRGQEAARSPRDPRTSDRGHRRRRRAGPLRGADRELVRLRRGRRRHRRGAPRLREVARRVESARRRRGARRRAPGSRRRRRRLVFSAKMAGFRLGFDILGPHGLMVCVALPATSEGNIEINPFALFAKDATIIYSAVGTVQDMRELVDLAAAGKVKSHVSRTGPLTELADHLRRARSRAVSRPGGAHRPQSLTSLSRVSR